VVEISLANRRTINRPLRSRGPCGHGSTLSDLDYGFSRWLRPECTKISYFYPYEFISRSVPVFSAKLKTVFRNGYREFGPTLIPLVVVYAQNCENQHYC